jgi:hypothetical protein
MFGFNGGAMFGFNGRAMFGFNGRAMFGFNGRAVSLDSQGCKPLGTPNMYRESRSDGIGSSCGYPVAPKSGSRPIANAGDANNTIAPRFTSPEGIFTRGSHPWLSNTIAPRFTSPGVHTPGYQMPSLRDSIQ